MSDQPLFSTFPPPLSGPSRYLFSNLLLSPKQAKVILQTHLWTDMCGKIMSLTSTYIVVATSLLFSGIFPDVRTKESTLGLWRGEDLSALACRGQNPKVAIY